MARIDARYDARLLRWDVYDCERCAALHDVVWADDSIHAIGVWTTAGVTDWNIRIEHKRRVEIHFDKRLVLINSLDIDEDEDVVLVARVA